MKIKRYLSVLIALLVGIMAMQAAEVRMEVSPGPGRRSIEVKDLFYITIEVVNLDGSPSQPSNVPGAKLVYFDRTGSSSSFTSINGKTSRSTSYTWTATLRAEKESAA